MSRRLLAAGALSPFTRPAPNVVSVSTAPNGGWTLPQDPKAMTYNGKTYLGWIDSISGATEVASFTHSTSTLSTPFSLAALGGPDNHDSPSILVRDSDKRVIVAYCRHEDPLVRLRISTNPEDVTAFAAEQTLDPGFGGVYTYTSMYQLLGLPNDPIYLFARSIPDLGTQTGRLVYAVSTDQGATWSSWTVLFTGAIANVPYWRLVSDRDRYIHVMTTNTAPNASNTYHFYIDGSTGTAYKSDGTEITTALPFTYTSLTPVLTTGGACWSWGVSLPDSRHPAGVLMQDISGDNRILAARWNGSAWVVTTVVASVGGQLGINQYASGCAIHHNNPNVIYAAKKIAGKFEMFRYVSGDSGATWEEVQLTSGSSVDHVWPDTVTEAAGLEAVWLRGSYTNDTTFSFGISGHRV